MSRPATTQPIETTMHGIVSGNMEARANPPYPRSPLRYPGGKSRAITQIMEYIPPDIPRLCAPFVGGGSIELACAARGVDVYAYDIFAPLVDFWQALLRDNAALADKVERLYPLTRSKFYSLQRDCMGIKDKLERAAAFFALNRSSFSGATLSGGMSPDHPRFTVSSIERLRSFTVDNFRVRRADFQKSLKKHADDFLYLDPPYANGGSLYGERGNCHTNFDHEALAEILGKRDGWILSYNDCRTVRSLYSKNKILRLKWSYGMGADKQSDEVLILSRDFIRTS